jgi:hypothetical protein
MRSIPPPFVSPAQTGVPVSAGKRRFAWLCKPLDNAYGAESGLSRGEDPREVKTSMSYRKSSLGDAVKGLSILREDVVVWQSRQSDVQRDQPSV